MLNFCEKDRDEENQEKSFMTDLSNDIFKPVYLGTFGNNKSESINGQFREDNKLFVSGSMNGTVAIYDIERKKSISELKKHDKSVYKTAFHGKNEVLSVSDDKSIKLWDISGEDPIVDIKNAHDDVIRNVSIIDEHCFATGS